MILTPLKAIRAKCVDCCCGNRAEVRRCSLLRCPLYPYRMGKRPKGCSDTTEEETLLNTPENPAVPTPEEE